jgi:AmiR/NasT family two-component response regulator
VIEQAKGVIAYRESLDIAQSYVWLRSMAADRGLTLSEAARLVIDQAKDGPPAG